MTVTAARLGLIAVATLFLAAAASLCSALDPYAGPPKPVRATTPCRITRVVDGDTIECGPGGRIRLIGIDSPEPAQRPFGERAGVAVAAMLPVGEDVALEQDVEARDRYGRLLAYVWRDGKLVNWMIVRAGWAVQLTYPPNVQYVEFFTRAERAARADSSGLWATGGFDCPPRAYRRGECR